MSFNYVSLKWNIIFPFEEKDYMYGYSSRNQKGNKIKTLMKAQYPKESQPKDCFLTFYC